MLPYSNILMMVPIRTVRSTAVWVVAVRVGRRHNYYRWARLYNHYAGWGWRCAHYNYCAWGTCTNQG